MSIITIDEKNACIVNGWIKDKLGVSEWESVNLSNLGVCWLTPHFDADGKKFTKPNWQSANEPRATTLYEADILVRCSKEVKRFHVATRVSSNRLSLKVTDGGSRRIEREVEKAGEDAWYEFDYSDYKNAVILVPEKTISLEEYLNKESKNDKS